MARLSMSSNDIESSSSLPPTATTTSPAITPPAWAGPEDCSTRKFPSSYWQKPRPSLPASKATSNVCNSDWSSWSWGESTSLCLNVMINGRGKLPARACTSSRVIAASNDFPPTTTTTSPSLTPPAAAWPEQASTRNAPSSYFANPMPIFPASKVTEMPVDKSSKSAPEIRWPRQSSDPAFVAALASAANCAAAFAAAWAAALVLVWAAVSASASASASASVVDDWASLIISCCNWYFVWSSSTDSLRSCRPSSWSSSEESSAASVTVHRFALHAVTCLCAVSSAVSCSELPSSLP